MPYVVDEVSSIRQRIAQIKAALDSIDARLTALEGFDATLGTMALQDSDAVAITGGTIDNIPAKWG